MLEFLDRAGITDFQAGVIMLLAFCVGTFLSHWLGKD